MSEVSPAPSGKPSWLNKKIFGVQVLYLLAIGVLVLAYFAWKMRSAPEPKLEVDPDLAPENADASAGVYDGFDAQPTPTYNPALGSTTTVESNDSWLKKGVEWAQLSGLAGAGEAQLALQKYLNGDQLSFREGSIRDAVIRQFGAPPENVVIGPADQPALAKRQGTPPCYHTVKGPNDNSYQELVLLYWGGVTNDKIDLLQVNNKSLGKSGPFPVGTRVFIPKYTAPKYFISTSKYNTLKEIAAKNGTSVTSLRILNDGIKDTLKVGTKVRVA